MRRGTQGTRAVKRPKETQAPAVSAESCAIHAPKASHPEPEASCGASVALAYGNRLARPQAAGKSVRRTEEGEDAQKRARSLPESSPEPRTGYHGPGMADATPTPVRTLKRRPRVGRSGKDQSRDQSHRDLCRENRARRDSWELRTSLGRSQSTRTDLARPRKSTSFNPPPSGGLLSSWRRSQWASLAETGLAKLESAQGIREAAWNLRDAGRAVQSRDRCSACGWARIGEVAVTRRSADLGGGFALASVETCGSASCCPVCALAIKGRRAAELQDGFRLHRLHHGAESVAMMTLTVRHKEGDSLQDLQDGYQRAWDRFWRTRPTLDREEARQAKRGTLRGPLIPTFDGIIGGVHGVEVTHGQNGWHYHRHKALAFDSNRSPEQLQRLQMRAAIWWNECVAREMGEGNAPSLERGCVVTESHRDDYLSKLGLEVSDVGVKESKNGNRSHWGILAAAAEGDAIGRDLWAEYAAAMHGRKLVQFSQGLIDHWRELGWRQKASDAVLAVEAEKGAELSLEIPGPAWTVIRQTGAAVWALAAEEPAEVLQRFRQLARCDADWRPIEGWGTGKETALRRDMARERTGEMPLDKRTAREVMAAERCDWRRKVDALSGVV